MIGIKRPQSRVVPEEDLWDILENAHNELSHAERDRMHTYFIEHMYHIPREVTALFIRLCHTSHAIKGRKSTRIIHMPIIPTGIGVRGQVDLVDLQLSLDYITSSSSTTRTVSANLSSLDHSGPRLQMRWLNAWCISYVSTVPLISCTRIMALSSQVRY